MAQTVASCGTGFSTGTPTTTSSWSAGSGWTPAGWLPLPGVGAAFGFAFGAGLVLLAAGAAFGLAFAVLLAAGAPLDFFRFGSYTFASRRTRSSISLPG